MPSREKINREMHNESSIPKATRRFTDREEERKRFLKLIEKAKREAFDDYYVINFYGSCGVGKTALLAELERNVREQDKHAIILHFDFRSIYLDDEKLILDRLEWQLQQVIPRLNFPLYNMACFLLNQSEGQIINNENNKRAISTNPILALLVDLFAEITGLGYISIVREAAVTLSKPVRDLFSKNKDYYKRCIQHMRNMGPNELRHNLPLYFARDVNEYDHDTLYVFFDTYEAYTHETVKDEWIHGMHGLVRNLGDAVFIIASQHKLKWQEDDFWKPRLESHIIHNLSVKDSVDFLSSCDVTPKSLCHEIFQLTNGSPLWLDLCVGQYFNLKNSGQDINIQSIGSKKSDLVDRHLKYVSKHMRDVYCLISAMKQWNDELLDMVLDAINIRMSVTEYDELLEQPYITYNDNTGVYSLSYEVGEILKTKVSEKILSKTLICIMTYLKNQSLGEPLLTDERTVNTFSIALKIAFNLSELSDTPIDLIDITCKFGWYQMQRFCYSSSIDFLTMAINLSKMCTGENSEKTRFAKSRLAIVLERTSTIREAIKINEELLSTSNSETNKDHDYMSVRNNLANEHRSIGNMCRALSLQKEVLDYIIAKYGEDNEDTWHAQNNIALTYNDLDLYDKAREIQEQVYEKRKIHFGIEHIETISAALNLANTYMTLAKLNHSKNDYMTKSEDLLRTGITYARKLPPKDFRFLLCVEHSLARCEAKIGNYTEAEKLIQEVIEGRKRILGEAHIAVLDALYIYAVVLYLEKKQPDCATVINQIKQYKTSLDNYLGRKGEMIVKLVDLWDSGMMEQHINDSTSFDQLECLIINSRN